MARKSLKQLAQAELSKSPLVVGKEKLDTEDILNEVVTAYAFDMCTALDKEIAEYGSVDEASAALEEEGGIQFIVRPKPKGKQYYPIDIL